jgi:uncharacterized protein (DUF1015 family)
MATLRAFRGFRPPSQFAAAVASEPYDVLSSEEARAKAEGKPHSFLHVTKPEIDLPPGISLYDDRVYRKGKENLEKLIAAKILQQDGRPCLYLYAQTMGGNTQYGLVGCVSVEEYRNNTIRKHELTRREKEDDRTKHVKATNAHTGPIFLTYRADPALDGIVNHIRTTNPEYDFVADDGVRHEFWVISEIGTIQSIVDQFKHIEHLYIADGHHRAAAAARVAKELEGASSHRTGEEEYNYFLAVLFPHNQLRIMSYNRVVRDLSGKSLGEFLEGVSTRFDVHEESSQARPSAKGELGMYIEGRWYRLSIPAQLLKSPDPVERLDVAILQKLILGPLLGIDDPRTSKRIDFVGGIRGLKELERRVDLGEMAVAFALYPTSIDELFAIADAGKIMPPKSTWFEPKLRDGVVVHLLS